MTVWICCDGRWDIMAPSKTLNTLQTYTNIIIQYIVGQWRQNKRPNRAMKSFERIQSFCHDACVVVKQEKKQKTHTPYDNNKKTRENNKVWAHIVILNVCSVVRWTAQCSVDDVGKFHVSFLCVTVVVLSRMPCEWQQQQQHQQITDPLAKQPLYASNFVLGIAT